MVTEVLYILLLVAMETLQVTSLQCILSIGTDTPHLAFPSQSGTPVPARLKLTIMMDLNKPIDKPSL